MRTRRKPFSHVPLTLLPIEECSLDCPIRLPPSNGSWCPSFQTWWRNILRYSFMILFFIFIFGSSFNDCLINLALILKRYKETNLVLNWEKCYFMVEEGMVLRNKISSKGIEVDMSKIDVIAKLPPPVNVKEEGSFLGHGGFYNFFIKEFSLFLNLCVTYWLKMYLLLLMIIVCMHFKH